MPLYDLHLGTVRQRLADENQHLHALSDIMQEKLFDAFARERGREQPSSYIDGPTKS